MKLRVLIFTLLAMGLMSQPLFAALIAYEGFDYDNSTNVLAGRNGGTGWAGPWGNTTTNPNVNTPYLTTDDVSIASPPNPFPPVGDRIHKTGPTAGHTNFSTVSRLFAPAGSGLNMGTDGTLFVSYSWTKTDGGTSGDNLEFLLFDSQSATMVLRAGVTSGSAGPSNENHFLNQSTAVAAGDQYGAILQSTKYFTVLKITANATGDDMVQVINYTSLPPALEPGTWDKFFNFNFGSLVNANQVRLIMGNNTVAQFDELRIGTTWDDVAVPVVVPEPNSMALLLLSVITGLCARNRG